MGMEGNPASSPLSLSPESIIRKCKIYNGLWRGDDTWAEDTRARSKFASPSPKSIIRKCKIYNGFWRRDDIGGWRISSPRVLFPRAEKVSSGNVKFTMDFSGAMIHGRRISSPRVLFPRAEKVSSGNVKFTMDFGGEMILGDGEYPRLESSFPELRKYHQEM